MTDNLRHFLVVKADKAQTPHEMVKNYEELFWKLNYPSFQNAKNKENVW